MSVDPRIEPACAGFYNDPSGMTDWTRLVASNPALADSYRAGMTRALAAADEAATITTMEGLDALPVGSRVVIAELYLERDPEPVDNGVWRDLGIALHLDEDELRYLLEVHPARVIRWGKP